MCIFEHDTSCITKHTSEISAYRNAVTYLVFTIIKRDSYTPADLEYIANNTNEILKSEKKFLEIYRKSVNSEKKLIARTVRRVVREVNRLDPNNVRTKCDDRKK